MEVGIEMGTRYVQSCIIKGFTAYLFGEKFLPPTYVHSVWNRIWTGYKTIAIRLLPQAPSTYNIPSIHIISKYQL